MLLMCDRFGRPVGTWWANIPSAEALRSWSGATKWKPLLWCSWSMVQFSTVLHSCHSSIFAPNSACVWTFCDLTARNLTVMKFATFNIWGVVMNALTLLRHFNFTGQSSLVWPLLIVPAGSSLWCCCKQKQSPWWLLLYLLLLVNQQVLPPNIIFTTAHFPPDSAKGQPTVPILQCACPRGVCGSVGGAACEWEAFVKCLAVSEQCSTFLLVLRVKLLYLIGWNEISLA